MLYHKTVNLKKLRIFFSLVFIFVLAAPFMAAHAQSSPDAYYRAKVLSILDAGQKSVDGEPMEYQTVSLEIVNGDEKGKEITVDHGGLFAIDEHEKVRPGEVVVVTKSTAEATQEDFYYITEKYRAPRLGIVALIFFGLAVGFGGRYGLRAILGMGLSILVIFSFIIPRILQGNDPFLVCMLGALMILFLSLYVSHGFNRRITIALISTLLTFGAALLLDFFFVTFVKLFGTGTEEAFYLQFGTVDINLRGLLLGGIIIGVLGVLDDITTAQAATIEEIHLANPQLSFRELSRKGLSVGREHIASLVNTLMLAYAGASLPLLLLFSNRPPMPLWLTFNSNFIAEEIVRTLVGSSALIIAVPVTTFLAAYWYSRTPSSAASS
ncbi:MAG: YibE/F family protein [Patescibacteria group bacterium]